MAAFFILFIALFGAAYLFLLFLDMDVSGQGKFCKTRRRNRLLTAAALSLLLSSGASLLIQ